jgi:hypothetical protein
VIIHEKDIAVSEPLIGFIRTRLDSNLTANAVRPTDPPDDDAHA